MKSVKKYLGQNRHVFCLAVLIGIVYSFVCIRVPVLSGQLVNQVIGQSSSILKYVLLYLGFSCLQILCYLADEYLGQQLQIRQKELMRRKAFAAFSKQDAPSKEEIAGFVSFVNNDIPSIAQDYFGGIVEILKCCCLILFSSVTLFKIHWIMALIILVISVGIVAYPQIMRKKCGEARARYSKSFSLYNTTLQSLLGGLNILKSYRYNSRANDLLDEDNHSVAQRETGVVGYNLSVHAVTASLQTIKTILVIVVGMLLIHQGKMSIGDLVIVLQFEEVVGTPIDYLAYLQNCRNEVKPLFNQYADALEAAEKAEKAGAAAAPCQQDFEMLSVRNISVQTANFQILHHVSWEFHAGKKYLITGPSGSGKSTLLSLLARIGKSDYQGEIFYNGSEIRTLEPNSYYNVVCPVFQTPYLFHADLEENITLGRKISQERFHEVIEKLNLSYLLQRYEHETLTPEIMEKLSGGEKQRIALARAMVTKPQVYLLDEVLSALDHNTSYEIEKILLQEPAAVIHVCHKPNPELEKQYDVHLQLFSGHLSNAQDL